jgi:hypothetical protein
VLGSVSVAVDHNTQPGCGLFGALRATFGARATRGRDLAERSDQRGFADVGDPRGEPNDLVATYCALRLRPREVGLHYLSESTRGGKKIPEIRPRLLAKVNRRRNAATKATLLCTRCVARSP